MMASNGAIAVRAAGEIARTYYGGDYKRWSKNKGEPVTEADLAVDLYLNESLLAARPDYGWLSEEGDSAGTHVGAARAFIVDPIDGTTAFLKGKPHFSVSVAVAEDGAPVAAAVYNPITDEFFGAALGCGARLNGAVIRVSACAHLLGQIPYQEVRHDPIVLPPRVHNPEYHRGPIPREMYVPAIY